jgi:hypothetical protein
MSEEVVITGETEEIPLPAVTSLKEKGTPKL